MSEPMSEPKMKRVRTAKVPATSKNIVAGAACKSAAVQILIPMDNLPSVSVVEPRATTRDGSRRSTLHQQFPHRLCLVIV